MVLKQMRATYLNGHEGHVFKLSTADFLVVKKLTKSAVAVRCSVIQMDHGVSFVEAWPKRLAFCNAGKLGKNVILNTTRALDDQVDAQRSPSDRRLHRHTCYFTLVYVELIDPVVSELS